jgi:hypothetical protein
VIRTCGLIRDQAQDGTQHRVERWNHGRKLSNHRVCCRDAPLLIPGSATSNGSRAVSGNSIATA